MGVQVTNEFVKVTNRIRHNIGFFSVRVTGERRSPHRAGCSLILGRILQTSCHSTIFQLSVCFRSFAARCKTVVRAKRSFDQLIPSSHALTLVLAITPADFNCLIARRLCINSSSFLRTAQAILVFCVNFIILLNTPVLRRARGVTR